jgi:HAE1 family hydrophobic/amphiphilic exporter-1
MGRPRFEAALEGGREIGFTVLSMTLSLAAVFIPVLFMSVIIGRLFHEFAVVIIVAILISGFVSLSLTPMLCSRFLKPPAEEHHNALYRASERVFDGMRDIYGWSLRGVVRHRFLTLMLAFGTLAATVYLYGIVPKGFIPSQDTGMISATTEFPQDASFEAMNRAQEMASQVVAADPNVEHFTVFTNAGQNFGRINIRLTPRSVR